MSLFFPPPLFYWATVFFFLFFEFEREVLIDGRYCRLYRDVRAYAIPGGSEEIMLDLSIRQALRVHKALGMKL